MHTTTHYPISRFRLLSVGLVALIALLLGYQEVAAYWYTSYSANNGYNVWRDQYVGPSTFCPTNRIEIEFRVRDADTRGPLVTGNELWLRMRYKEPGQSVVYAPWVDLTGFTGKASVCVPRDAWSAARVYSDPGSTYVGANIVTNRSSATSTRDLELGHHYVRTIYLARHTDTVPTAQPIFPINTVASSSEQFRIRVNEIPPIHGATGVSELFYEVSNFDTGNDISREFNYSSSGIGEYTFAAPGVTDGFQEWFVTADYNGENTLSNGRRYIEMPQTNFFQDWFNFVYDATPPNSALATNVVMQNENTQRISLTNTASDVTTGLAQTILVIENRTTGARTNITQNFPLAMGSYYGTWRDPQVVGTTVEVSRDHAYALYAITRDVAGNVWTTEPTIIPDRNGNTGGSVGTNLTVGLSASPASILLGAQSTLSWNIQNATGCTASWNPSFTFTNGVPGSLVVTPAATTNYILNCSNATSNASRQATVSVSTVPPTLTLTPTSQFVRTGESTTLTWSVTPPESVTSCTLSGIGSSPTSVSVSGSISTPTLTNQRTFTLSCTGPGGTYTTNATVQILAEVFER